MSSQLKENVEQIKSRGKRSVGDVSLDNADWYYSQLNAKIVSQGIVETLRGMPDFDDVYSHDEWINGIKEIIIAGVYDAPVDLVKDIVIGHFNPGDNDIKSVAVKIDKRQRLAFRIPMKEVIQAFVKPETAKAFVKNRVQQAYNTWKLLYFKHRSEILLKKTGAILDITYDKEVDIKDKKAIEILTLIRKQIHSFGTPSNKHTKFGTSNAKFIYSASPSNLVLVLDSNLAVDFENLAATLFNKDEVMLKIKIVKVDFSIVDATSKAKAILLDKSALIHGYQAENMASVLKLPLMYLLHEQFNFYGFARLKNYPIVLYKDST